MMQNQNLFDVILMGVESGINIGSVKSAVARLYNVEMHHVEHLFSGGRKVIRKNQTKENAERLANAFRAAGWSSTISATD